MKRCLRNFASEYMIKLLLWRALPGDGKPEGGSAVLSIPPSRAGRGAGAPEGGKAAAFGRLEGEAVRGLAFKGGTSFPPGKRLQVLGSKGIHELRSSTSALHHALEESASLLTMFWRVALPSTHIPVLPGKVGESTETELLELRTKVSKQERLLQSTAERLKTANQQKESMEQFIVSQLTRTHDVLKKARTNLESSTYRIACVKPYSCPRKGKIPKGSAVYSSLVTLAFQEPCKKCSHQKSLYRNTASRTTKHLIQS
nr:myomegalin-like isoform X4 [Pan troglodytes]